MPGVSVQDLGPKRYRVRWREWVELEDGSRKQRARSRVVHSREASVELQAKVLRALETVGYYEDPVQRVERVGNLEAAAAAWLRHKAARGCQESTIVRYAGSLKKIFRTLREQLGLRADEVVPTTALSRERFTDLQLAWMGEFSEATVYNDSSALLQVWRWAADEPRLYPGVAPAPLVSGRVLPLPPVYTAPTPPTLAETDACIRHLGRRSYVADKVAIVMRFTGLRVSQVLGIRCSDLDMSTAMLRVRVGKTRREKIEQRVIPVSRHLVDEVAPWVARAGSPDEPLIRRRKDQRSKPGKGSKPGEAIARGWERATEAGEVRRAVWQPEGRRLRRPEHAFRAAFQGFMEEKAVRDSVIDFLVGHAPRSVRGKHYSPPAPNQLRAAVDRMPPIAWKVRKRKAKGNVVAFRK